MPHRVTLVIPSVFNVNLNVVGCVARLVSEFVAKRDDWIPARPTQALGHRRTALVKHTSCRCHFKLNYFARFGLRPEASHGQLHPAGTCFSWVGVCQKKGCVSSQKRPIGVGADDRGGHGIILGRLEDGNKGG